MTRAVVLLSGGIDSAVALGWARRRYRAVVAVTFDVPGRPRGESRSCVRIAREAGIPLYRVRLPFLAARPGGEVPGRNLVFHAAAASLALRWGVPAVIAGHNASDALHFADARASFFRALRPLLGGVRVELPLLGMTDAQVARLGVRLGVPLARTWSCYRDGARPCGRCDACGERRAALLAAREGEGCHGLRHAVARRDRVLADVGGDAGGPARAPGRASRNGA